MKINYFNAEHTHALIDLPTGYSIEEVIRLFKGGSSYWINHSQIIKGRFAWGCWLWRVFSLAFCCDTRCSLHCQSRGASP
jgi:hypothetical protein